MLTILLIIVVVLLLTGGGFRFAPSRPPRHLARTPSDIRPVCLQLYNPGASGRRHPGFINGTEPPGRVRAEDWSAEHSETPRATSPPTQGDTHEGCTEPLESLV